MSSEDIGGWIKMVGLSSNSEWLDLLKEEVLEPDLPICDPHHHLWDRNSHQPIQPRYLLDEILDDKLTFNKFWQICYDSKRWEKWVGDNFDPEKNKEELIKICGHYVLSQTNFIKEIKLKFNKIDDKIIKNILYKLNKLHGY